MNPPRGRARVWLYEEPPNERDVYREGDLERWWEVLLAPGRTHPPRVGEDLLWCAVGRWWPEETP